MAAPTNVHVSDAQLSACTTPTGRTCKVLAGGGTAAVVDNEAASYLRLTTPDGGAKATVYTDLLIGQPLSALTTVSYRTLIETPGTSNNQQAPALNVAINPGRAGTDGRFFATLVWEPVYSGQPVVTGSWQTWTPTTTQGWRSTNAAPESTGVPNRWGFPSYTATFADVLRALPDATITSVAVNQGSGNPGLKAGVDEFTINDTTFNFENPTTLAIVSGNGQTAVALAPFTQPLTTKVTARAAVPAPGAVVTYTVNGSATFPGNVKTATATTGADGIATAPTLTAGLAPGPVTVTASTPGLPPVTFTLTVIAPPGPPVADLVVTVTGIPTTVAPGSTFTTAINVRNASSFPATQVRTSLTAPSGLRITAAPGALFTSSAATFTAPTLAPDATLTYQVTFRVDPTARGTKSIPVSANSQVRDPNQLNNTLLVPVVIR
jgi:hypothetical protein